MIDCIAPSASKDHATLLPYVFVLLPLLALVLRHETFSVLLIVIWVLLVLPFSILQALDFFRTNRNSRLNWLQNVMRVFLALFGLLAMLIGASIVVWVGYNVFVQMLPEYSGPGNIFELLVQGFGVGPAICGFGWYLLRLATKRSLS